MADHPTDGPSGAPTDQELRERLSDLEYQVTQCSATERYQHLLATHPTWARRLPLRHLASWLGITDVALSRLRRRLNTG